MTKISRDNIKKRGIKRFANSFKYSIEGLIYAYKNEQSLLIHFVATVFAVFLGILFGIEKWEWISVGLVLIIVLIVELFNTAIEATVDMVTLEINPLAKIAKDCGSAAAFVAAIAGTIICLTIFVPYFIALF